MANILFAGSPDFAVPTLRRLVGNGHELVGVLTQPDRPAGRGRKTQIGPVKEAALECGLAVMQPRSLKSADVQTEIKALDPDVIVVVAYGLLLPQAVLDIPRVACVNVHGSLLPRWRGASPIQSAILAGDQETGISIMKMEAGLDTGPVYTSQSTNIAARETASQLHDRLAILGSELLADSLAAIVSGELAPTPQDDDAATYAPRIDKSDAVIDWSGSAVQIDQQVRAYSGWPVAETKLDGQRLRCWSCLPLPPDGAQQNAPGAILAVSDDGIDVSTGDGILRLTEVQMSNRQRMQAAAFARGTQVLGKQLGQ